MNILILSWRGPGHPNAGGAEIATHEHAKGWVKAGHQVTLFTSSFPKSKKEEIVDGVEIKRAGNQFFGVHLQAIKWYLFTKHPKFDLVVDQFHGIPFFTPIYVRAKKFAFIHEVAKEVWRFNQWPVPFNFLIAGFGNIFEPLIFKLYRKIHFMTVSDSTKNDLTVWGIPKQNITIVHNGIIVPKVILKKESKNTVVFLGALTKDKGIETAIICVDYLQKKFDKDIQFWIIGRGDQKYLEFLKSKADSLGVKNIKFCGFVDEGKKFELLAKAHILINPSIREGWSLVVIEAAAMGTPTVGFNVAGLRDSIIDGKTGVLSNEQTAEALANKIVELLKDEIKLKQLSKNAIFWSKNFSWKKSTKFSLKLIEKIAG